MTAAAVPTRRSTVAVAFAALAWLVALAWMRPLLLPDEGRYVGVAWEMLRSGDWLTPTLNGLPYFHKPPLFYWITAASLQAFELGEWAARAAPLLGAWLAAMSVFVLVRRWWSERSAMLTLVALLSMPLFYLGGQFANLDMLVAGFITATIAALAHAALSRQAALPYRRALLCAYAMAALGVLAKGLIGVVLPALVVFAWLAAGHRWRTVLALLSPAGALVFLAIVTPWFVAMQMRFPGFADYFFVVQQFKRYLTSGFNNVHPFWFFPAVLILCTLPWIGWLRAQWGRARLTDPERGDLRLLAICWVVVVVGFFSLPRSKLLGYVLPAVPPLALLVADGFETLELRFGAASRRAWRWACGAGVAVSLALVGVAAAWPMHSTREIGQTLRLQVARGEPVVMIGGFWFDLPFYARLHETVIVVDAWSSPDVRRRDNWRKELADAATFAPAADAARLVEPAALCARLAGQGRAWIVADAALDQRIAMLKSAEKIVSVRGTALWRMDRADARLKDPAYCEGTPNGDSRDM